MSLKLREGEKQMKKIIENIIFIICFIGFPILASALVEFLSSIITMEMIMNILGVLFIISIIYIIKN